MFTNNRIIGLQILTTTKSDFATLCLISYSYSISPYLLIMAYT